MADKKISELDSATLPLNDADLVAVVQDGVTKKAPKIAFGSSSPSGGSSDLIWTYSKILADPFEHAGTTALTIMDVCEISEYVDLSKSLIFELETYGRAVAGTIPTVSFYICDENLNLINNSTPELNTLAGFTTFGDTNRWIDHRRKIYKHSSSRTYHINKALPFTWYAPVLDFLDENHCIKSIKEFEHKMFAIVGFEPRNQLGTD